MYKRNLPHTNIVTVKFDLHYSYSPIEGARLATDGKIQLTRDTDFPVNLLDSTRSTWPASRSGVLLLRCYNVKACVRNKDFLYKD